MMARCEGNEIEILDRVFLPHSLGSLYTMICEFIGYSRTAMKAKSWASLPTEEILIATRSAKSSAEEWRLPA
jgi:predicted NodU family carbamoyl transferase